jgi:hypothetical protein
MKNLIVFIIAIITLSGCFGPAADIILQKDDLFTQPLKKVLIKVESLSVADKLQTEEELVEEFKTVLIDASADHELFPLTEDYSLTYRDSVLKAQNFDGILEIRPYGNIILYDIQGRKLVVAGNLKSEKFPDAYYLVMWLQGLGFTEG